MIWSHQLLTLHVPVSQNSKQKWHTDLQHPIMWKVISTLEMRTFFRSSNHKFAKKMTFEIIEPKKSFSKVLIWTYTWMLVIVIFHLLPMNSRALMTFYNKNRILKIVKSIFMFVCRSFVLQDESHFRLYHDSYFLCFGDTLCQ